MAESVQEELEDRVGLRLWTVIGSNLQGIIRQVVPIDDPNEGDAMHGRSGTPFVSISSVLPEQFIENQGWNDRDLCVRTVTVVLYAEKLEVKRDQLAWKAIREQAIRSVQKQRWVLTQTGSCVWNANVRQRSALEASVWLYQGRFLSAFDVVFRVQEPRIS